MGKKILILYFVSVLLGILTGAIASLFQLTIQQMDHLLELLFHMTESYGLACRNRFRYDIDGDVIYCLDDGEVHRPRSGRKWCARN